jgi:hypothetical protein
MQSSDLILHTALAQQRQLEQMAAIYGRRPHREPRSSRRLHLPRRSRARRPSGDRGILSVWLHGSPARGS